MHRVPIHAVSSHGWVIRAKLELQLKSIHAHRSRTETQTGQLHFITFSRYRRLPYLKDAAPKNTLEQVIEKARRSHSLSIHAYVLMPEHVHLLTNEPVTNSQPRTLASFLSVVKGESSKLLKGPREKFWQTRYYDFNTFTTGKFVEKIQYIHRNPVTRGLVPRPEDYRWSSFNHYATGAPTTIQIDSQWVDRKRFALRANARPCDETA